MNKNVYVNDELLGVITAEDEWVGSDENKRMIVSNSTVAAAIGDGVVSRFECTPVALCLWVLRLAPDPQTNSARKANSETGYAAGVTRCEVMDAYPRGCGVISNRSCNRRGSVR